jgi:hypothetical protein
MATVFVGDHQFEAHSHRLKSVTLTVQYRGPQVEVSISGIPPLSDQEHERWIRDEILRLGQAIVQAAQSPQGIIGLPAPPRER